MKKRCRPMRLVLLRLFWHGSQMRTAGTLSTRDFLRFRHEERERAKRFDRSLIGSRCSLCARLCWNRSKRKYVATCRWITSFGWQRACNFKAARPFKNLFSRLERWERPTMHDHKLLTATLPWEIDNGFAVAQIIRLGEILHR